jgi:hypothetical protein
MRSLHNAPSPPPTPLTPPDQLTTHARPHASLTPLDRTLEVAFRRYQTCHARYSVVLTRHPNPAPSNPNRSRSRPVFTPPPWRSMRRSTCDANACEPPQSFRTPRPNIPSTLPKSGSVTTVEHSPYILIIHERRSRHGADSRQPRRHPRPGHATPSPTLRALHPCPTGSSRSRFSSSDSFMSPPMPVNTRAYAISRGKRGST